MEACRGVAGISIAFSSSEIPCSEGSTVVIAISEESMWPP